jgi:MFS transporter, SHS family, sialic acid transporter
MPTASASPLTKSQCVSILTVAFLGWMFAGVQMGINGIVHHPAARDLLGASAYKAEVAKWSGWLVVAFLLGAAAGGYLFGWVGDRFGRSRAMSLSIGCYAVFSAVSVFSPSVEAFWVLRFLTCIGIGGMWPNGMALLQEAWPNTAKPILAGVLGTSANVGIMFFAVLCMQVDVTPDHWHWAMFVGASPIVLAVASWFLVPESPKWLAEQQQSMAGEQVGLSEVFSPPHLRLTMIGIVLAFVPLFGGWGVANWANYWSAEFDEQVSVTQEIGGAGSQTPADTGSDTWPGGDWECPSCHRDIDLWASKCPNCGDVFEGQGQFWTFGADGEMVRHGHWPVKRETGASETKNQTTSNLKAQASFHRSWPGAISSLLGGALAFLLGRRLSYALLCLLAFACTQFLYSVPDPSADGFLFWVRGLGFFSGFFFGWLPLCLPEMFPTRVRSTGSGVSFNFGRVIVALLIIVTSLALKSYFEGSYDQVGRVCGYVYLLGVVAVFLLPTITKNSELGEEGLPPVVDV